MLFIHGIGAIGEIIEVVMYPSVLDYHERDLAVAQITFELQFKPVTMYVH